MKTTQLLTVAVALLIPFASHANDIGGTAADPDDNQELQDVHLTTAEIVIDGDLSEWEFNNPIVDPLIGIPKIGRDGREEGTPPSQFVVHEELGGSWTGPDDQSTSTEFVWKVGSENPDEDGLYMGVIVTDDYHENAANSGWNGDSLQMMVTFYDSDFEEHSASDFALYNFALGGVEEELDPADPVIVAHFEQAFAFTTPEEFVEVGISRDTEAKKTFYELFFGIDALGVFELEEGTQFGIGMAFNDGDEDAPGQAGWAGLGAHAIVFGKTPSEAALLTLAPEFVAPPSTGVDGDADGDGDVDFDDFVLLSNSFSQAVDPPGSGADFDGSGTVDFDDFVILSNNFGVTAATSVPEPSAFALCCCAGVLLLTAVRRRNR